MTGGHARRKALESAALIQSFFDEELEARLERCAGQIAARLGRGGQLVVFGNGGSACDAQHLAVEFQHPIVEKRRALPARALVTDAALISAVGNDTDFSRVYLEQIELSTRSDDVAVGISTSGHAANVVLALRRARARGLLTVGLAGRDGGALVDLAEHAFVVPSWSIHRIQEVHTVLLHLLWDAVHLALGEPDVL